jgi:TatD DNase family protein
MLIDSHCHLERFAKRGDLDTIINEAGKAGVNRMITVGTSTEDWDLYRSLAERYPGRIHYTVGLHPCHVEEGWQLEVEALQKRLKATDVLRPVAIGEIGLDYFHLPKDPEARALCIARQKAAFEAQLAIAADHTLPLIIHSRDAFNDTVRWIDSSGVSWNRVVFHCFSEGVESVDRINLRGGRASFTANITFPADKSAHPRAALTEQGAERLMIETDCPYLAPHSLRGSENQPANLRHIVQTAAALLQIPSNELESQITRNTLDFFHLPR